MKALACCALAALGLVPTPIGTGLRYRPPARPAGFKCAPAPIHAGARVHLELFANRRVLIVPAAIGLAAAKLEDGRVTHAACRADAWTLDPSGVVRFEGGITLGRVFRIWAQPLAPDRLCSFLGRVSVYVNGRARPGDPSTLRLRDRDEIVLEVRGYVPPHRSFTFPP